MEEVLLSTSFAELYKDLETHGAIGLFVAWLEDDVGSMKKDQMVDMMV
jgi:hypothetical protein